MSNPDPGRSQLHRRCGHTSSEGKRDGPHQPTGLQPPSESSATAAASASVMVVRVVVVVVVVVAVVMVGVDAETSLKNLSVQVVEDDDIRGNVGEQVARDPRGPPQRGKSGVDPVPKRSSGYQVEYCS